MKTMKKAKDICVKVDGKSLGSYQSEVEIESANNTADMALATAEGTLGSVSLLTAELIRSGTLASGNKTADNISSKCFGVAGLILWGHGVYSMAKSVKKTNKLIKKYEKLNGGYDKAREVLEAGDNLITRTSKDLN